MGREVVLSKVLAHLILSPIYLFLIPVVALCWGISLAMYPFAWAITELCAPDEQEKRRCRSHFIPWTNDL